MDIYGDKLVYTIETEPLCISSSNFTEMLTLVYANYFYDTSVIFSNSIITYREPFTICIGHDRRTDVIGIDCYKLGWEDGPYWF